MPCFFIARRFQLFLVDLRRTVLTHARRSQQLLILFVFVFANKFQISPRWDSISRTKTSSIGGLPLDHQSDRPVRALFFLFLFFSPSQLLSSPFVFFLPPRRISDPGSHSRLLSPLLTTVRALHFYRDKISALHSSTCVELCLPTLGILSNCCCCCCFFCK